MLRKLKTSGSHPATTRHKRVVERVLTILFAVTGAFLALLVAGDVQAPIGPFDATLSAKPSLHSGTKVELAPLGSLEMDTHRGPLGLTMRVDELRVDEAREIARNPDEIEDLEADLASDTSEAVTSLAVRVALVMVAGAMALSVLRRPGLRSAISGLLTGVALFAMVAVTTVVTWEPRALAEPRYTGLLSLAPRAVGDARDVADRFSEYRSQLTGLVKNVVLLYDTAEGLQSFEPDGSTVSVLHVSDLHLNPEGFDLIEQLVEQFAIDVVVDTGDINDWGTPFESQFVDRIGDLGVPYVYVRGNHDSQVTESAVAAQPNAVVLDGESETVAGVTFWGVGDPRFTPDKTEYRGADEQRAKAEDFAGEVADGVKAEGADQIDIALVHDPIMAAQLEDLVPLVLAGHKHEPSEDRLGSTILLTEGSTGGTGLRALQGDEAEPLTCSVLYLDVDTKRLQAYDRITVGGLGTGTASIERHITSEETADEGDPGADTEDETDTTAENGNPGTGSSTTVPEDEPGPTTSTTGG